MKIVKLIGRKPIVRCSFRNGNEVRMFIGKKWKFQQNIVYHSCCYSHLVVTLSGSSVLKCVNCAN